MVYKLHPYYFGIAHWDCLVCGNEIAIVVGMK